MLVIQDTKITDEFWYTIVKNELIISCLKIDNTIVGLCFYYYSLL